MDGGELLRPFGPGQIALKFSHVVGALNVPLSKEELEFRPRHAGVFGRSAERQQTACIQSHRHLLRHLRLRRRRRQVDFLQKAIGNIKCQRHSDKIAASAENGKLSTGPRSIERGNERLRSTLTDIELASTGPRSRENGKLRISSFSSFAHIRQEPLNQRVCIENSGISESFHKWFHLANGAGVLAPGENSKGADGAEVHANSHLACWQIVEQKREASFDCKYDCLGFACTETFAQVYQRRAFLHRNNSNPICSNRFPDAGLCCARGSRCINFTINSLRNKNGIKCSLNKVKASDSRKRDQRR
jgi:hypothetical protein